MIVKADAFSAQTEISENNNLRSFPITITAPDLTVSAATAAGTAAVNQSIPVSWTVQNLSATSPASADWQDRVYLSSDAVLDGSDRFLSSQNISQQTPLAAGASYTLTQDVTLPGVAAGDYFLLFETNSDRAQRRNGRNEQRPLAADHAVRART